MCIVTKLCAMAARNSHKCEENEILDDHEKFEDERGQCQPLFKRIWKKLPKMHQENADVLLERADEFDSRC